MNKLFASLLVAALATSLSLQAAPVKRQAQEAAGQPTAGSQADAIAAYDALLKKYVRGDYFAYGELTKNKSDLARFNRFLAWQATAPVKEMSREDQIAFYINAYNSCCIKAVLDHY